MAVQGDHQNSPVQWFTVFLIVCGLTSLGVTWLAHAETPTETASAQTMVVSLAPVIPPARGEQCVADTDLMRSDHMELLKHQQDETVIEGKRDNPFSLIGCVDCHAQVASDGSPIRIDAEGQFCESCHSYAAVKIDCFSCHAAVPEQDNKIGFYDSTESLLAKAQPHSMLPLQLRAAGKVAGFGKNHGYENALVNAN